MYATQELEECVINTYIYLYIFLVKKSLVNNTFFQFLNFIYVNNHMMDRLLKLERFEIEPNALLECVTEKSPIKNFPDKIYPLNCMKNFLLLHLY